MRRSEWIFRSGAASSVAAFALLAAGCGGGTHQDAAEPSGSYPVAVSASFPTQQRLSEHTKMTVTVRNTGSATIPNVTVTVTDPQHGTAVQPFGMFDPQPDVAYHSRPVWIVDRPPGTCAYSCRNGGNGSATSAYANTWALGRLAPGATATFTWALTAVATGTHAVAYQVAAGLNGKAVAKDASGTTPQGQFTVTINGQPAPASVSDTGQVITQSGGGNTGAAASG